MALRYSVQNLLLIAREILRGELNTKILDLNQRMLRLGFPGYVFTADPNQLFAYADVEPATSDLGACIFEYFDAFVRHIERFTKYGSDIEAVVSLRKVAPNNMVVLMPDEEKRISICGCVICEGQVRLLFHPDNLGANTHTVARNLGKAVDAASDDQANNILPFIIRRAIVRDLDAKVPELQLMLRWIFGIGFVFETDVAKDVQLLRSHPEDFHPTTCRRVPDYILKYFEAPVEKLETREFGNHGRLRELFIDVTKKRIIRFEIVETLQGQHNKYSDCIFVGGELKIQTTPRTFGFHLHQVANDVQGRLWGVMGTFLG